MPHRQTDSDVCFRTPSRVLIYSEPWIPDGFDSLVAEAGYHVESAECAVKALEQFQQRDFPLVLVRTDMTCRGLDFVEQAHPMKSSAFIAVTNCAGCESAVRSLRAGARDYVVWPGNFEEIRFALARAFGEVERCRFKEDMLSMLTHDIKIPLSSIIGYSSLVFNNKSGQVNDRAQDFVRIINSNGNKILQLIDNFLTSHKIESGKLHLNLDDLDISLFFCDIISTFQAELDRHNLSVTLEIESHLPLIEADEALLFRAVGNLLSNACKFSPNGGAITISARALQGNAGGCSALQIAISNPGPGIEPADISEIFERYTRGHAQGSIEGSGLGAYVVKSIVEAHGGTIGVSSVANGLTTFIVNLPFQVGKH